MAVPTLVQHRSCSSLASATLNYTVKLPNPALSGNCIIVCISFADNVGDVQSITDDKSNTYTKLASIDDTTNTTFVQIFGAFNVTAGARIITAHTTNTQRAAGTLMHASEWYNVASASALDTQNATASSGTTVSAGNITPTVTGDLLYMFARRTTSTTATSFTAGSQSNITWQLLHADRKYGNVVQAGVYNSTSTINPQLTMAPTASYGAAVVALKAATQGTAPSRPINVVRVLSTDVPSPTASPQSVQFPCSGNLLVLSNHGQVITGITDTNSNTWVQAGYNVGPTGVNSGSSSIWYAANPTVSADMVITVTYTGTNDGTWMLYDITGAASSPFESFVGNRGHLNGITNVTMQAISPSNTNGIVITNTGIAFNTVDNDTDSTHYCVTTEAEGESISGPSPLDQNNAWTHMYNSARGPVQFQYTTISGALAVGDFNGCAASFLASGTTSKGFINPRIAEGHVNSASTVTSAAITTQAGDLVVLVGHASSSTPSATAFTDSQGHTYNNVSGLNPYNDATEGFKINVGWVIVTTPGSTTFTYNTGANDGITIQALVVTPTASGTTLNSSVTGTGRTAGSTTHNQASGTVAQFDLVVCGISVSNGVDDPVCAQASYAVGGQSSDGLHYIDSGTEFDLCAAASASQSDNFFSQSSYPSAQVIAAWSMPQGSQDIITRLDSFLFNIS